MSLESIDLIPLEQRLSQLTISLRNCDSEESWKEIENISHTLANGLRVHDGLVDNHSILGKTTLPRNLTVLLKLAMHGSPTPPDAFTSAVFELLRVAANICMDHDENRAHLLEAELLETLVSLLEGYLTPASISLTFTPIKLSISHLRVIRTAIGVLLNASIGFEPVKFKLISLDAAMTVLKLSTAVYPPGLWIKSTQGIGKAENFPSEDAWEFRSGLANWAWRVISELKDVKVETLQIFTPDILPILTVPLLAFSPPYPSRLSTLSKEDLVILALVDTDFEILQESCMLIESLSLDVEDIRSSLARGLNFPAEHSGVPCLSAILDFIENGDYPPFWNLYGEVERKRKEKAFDICKAALIKAVVEVAGEESNENVLWDDSEEDKPGGDFVCRMVSWIKRYVDDIEKTSPPQTLQPRTLAVRDDLAICASLTLGNLARRGKNTTALLSPPHSLAPVLTSQKIFNPSADIKVKHGVLGLLKNLSQTSTQSPFIQDTLGKASIIRRITESGIWVEQADAMADIVQLNAIGVVKHMCNANVEHTFALVLPSEELSSPPSSATGLAQILALIKRSDSIPIKSEGTRVLVNVVKSLWSSDFANAQLTESLKSPNSAKIFNNEILQEKQRKRAAAIRETLFPDYVEALSGLVGRSGKYPLLVNEGVVALSLISTQKEGGPLVLKAITTPLSLDVSAPTTDTPPSSTDVALSVTANTRTSVRLPVPRHALDMLLFALKNVDNPANFPIEVRANICSFFMQLGRHTSGDELNKVRNAVREVLVQLLDEDTLHGGQTRVNTLQKAIRRLMDTF